MNKTGPYKWAYFFVVMGRVEYSGETDESLRRRYKGTMYEELVENLITSNLEPGIFTKVGSEFILRSDL